MKNVMMKRTRNMTLSLVVINLLCTILWGVSAIRTVLSGEK